MPFWDELNYHFFKTCILSTQFDLNIQIIKINFGVPFWQFCLCHGVPEMRCNEMAYSPSHMVFKYKQEILLALVSINLRGKGKMGGSTRVQEKEITEQFG